MHMETTRVQGGGTHRDRPLTEAEKRAVAAALEESDEVWEARLIEREWAERRAARQAEDDQAAMLIRGGRWQ